MNLKFLGTGGAFDFRYGNASATIDLDKRILIDCGPSVFPALMEKNLIGTIDYLILTHLHGDHVGSLFQVIYYLKFFHNKTLKIACPSETFKTEIIALLSAMNISQSFYEIIPLTQLQNVEHIETTGKHSKNVTSFAYIFKDDIETIFYSGDLGQIDVLQSYLDEANIQNLTVFHDMTPIKNPAHVHYPALNALLPRAKIYAYHLDPEKVPDDNRVPLVIYQPEFMW